MLMPFRIRIHKSAFAGVALCLLALMSGRDAAAETEVATAKDPLTALGIKATTGAAEGYLPDRICGTCHAALYQSYQDVGMSHSFARATSANLIEEFDNASYFHAKSGRHYQMQRRGDELWFARWREDASGNHVDPFEVRVDWIIGSGNRARSYLYQTEAGELYQLPLGWYAEGRKWAMSPGYDLPRHDGISRQVRRECMFCHNAFPDVAAGSDQHEQPHLFPKDLPEGTGCQRCHGPAAEHVRAVLTGKPIDVIHAKIVNPGRLPWSTRNQVCFQCHLLPALEIIGQRRMDRGDYSFRPGQQLADYLLHVDINQKELPKSERFQINHHAYRMLQSTCYLKSEGNMGCTSCHDPHVKVKGDARIPWFRDKCLACHEGFAHDQPVIIASAEDKHTTADDCTRCHMPKRRTQDVVEVSMTDHRIARGPFDEAALMAPMEREIPGISDIEFFMPSQSPTGKEGNAYLALTILKAVGAEYALDMLQEQLMPLVRVPTPWLKELAEYQLKLNRVNSAQTTLEVLHERGVDDVTTRGLQSNVALLQGQPEQALTLLGSVNADSGLDSSREYNRALAYRALGKPEQAIAALQRAVLQRPVMKEAWFEMARNYQAIKRIDDARNALSRSLSIDPDYDRARQLLESLESQPELERTRTTP